MSQVLEAAEAVDESEENELGQFERLCSPRHFVAGVQLLESVGFVVIGLFLIGYGDSSVEFLSSIHLLLSVLAAASFHCVAQYLRVYEFPIMRRGPDSACRVGIASLVVAVPFLVLSSRGLYDPSAMVVLACIILIFPVLRLITARLIEQLVQRQLLKRNVYIISDDAAAVSGLHRAVERFPENRIVGMRVLPGGMRAGLTELAEFLRTNPVDAVIIKLSSSYPEPVIAVLQSLIGLPVAIYLSPPFDYDDGRIGPALFRKGTTLGDAVLLKLTDRPLTGWRWVLKDLQDRSIALLLLIVTAPVTLGTIAAIKLCDPGPVFFRQERRGYAGTTFRIIKFRTMKVTTSGTSNSAVLQLTTRNDPRVSSIGHVLRRTSLDELPQLLNVLKGDMWIVGPRPHPLRAQASGLFYPDAVQIYRARYHMKPGITGWAQVRGWRGPTDTLEQLRSRVEHDLYYIQNWSPLFDAAILVRTFRCIFGQENAF